MTNQQFYYQPVPIPNSSDISSSHAKPIQRQCFVMAFGGVWRCRGYILTRSFQCHFQMSWTDDTVQHSVDKQKCQEECRTTFELRVTHMTVTQESGFCVFPDSVQVDCLYTVTLTKRLWCYPKLNHVVFVFELSQMSASFSWCWW